MNKSQTLGVQQISTISRQGRALAGVGFARSAPHHVEGVAHYRETGSGQMNANLVRTASGNMDLQQSFFSYRISSENAAVAAGTCAIDSGGK